MRETQMSDERPELRKSGRARKINFCDPATTEEDVPWFWGVLFGLFGFQRGVM